VRVATSATLAICGIFASAFLFSFARPSVAKIPQAKARAEASVAHPALPASPVIVELFTSEGCSDCPPADQLLYRLEQTQPVPGVRIIALEQHVDYWDNEGWRDPFSSPQFTRRQKDYTYAFNLPTAYTPEMVVDGGAEFVGSDGQRALAAIARAALTPKADLRIDRRSEPNSDPRTLTLRVSLSAISGWNPKHGGDLFLAVTEDNLSSNVTSGENAGAHMIHRDVVRELRSLGRLDSAAAFSAEDSVNLRENWKLENLRLVAFVQDRSTRRILAASALPLSEVAK
jgi:hypothetical protein